MPDDTVTKANGLVTALVLLGHRPRIRPFGLTFFIEPPPTPSTKGALEP